MPAVKIAFECRLLTPLFLGGADGTERDAVPELRAPSLKGAMRFWWRAAQAEEDGKRLKKTEAGIFGGTGKGEGKSTFGIRMNCIGPLRLKKYQLLPHHSGDGNCFCVAANDGRCRKGMKRTAISPGQEFSVEFTSIRPHLALEQLKALFILTSILGGLGKRSRRGFGSFAVNAIDGLKLNREVNLEYVFELLEFLAPGKYRLGQNTIVLNSACRGKYPFIKEIAIGRRYGSAEELLKAIGSASHDYDEDCLGFVGAGEIKGHRLASPVCVSVICGDAGFRPVITTLHTESDIILRGDMKVQQDFKVAIL